MPPGQLAAACYSDGMTRAQADEKARDHALKWAALATAFTAWALRRTSMLALIYAALVDAAAVRHLAALYRAPRAALAVAGFTLPATCARVWLLSHPWPVRGLPALLACFGAHALYAGVATLALRLRARV